MTKGQLICSLIAVFWGSQRASGAEPKVGDPMPFAALIINKESREVYVYPASAAEDYTKDSGGSTNLALNQTNKDAVSFKAVPELPKILASETEINTLTTPLPKRAAIYVQTIIRALTGSSAQLVSSPTWSLAVLKVFERFAFLDLLRTGNKHLWPFQTPLSMSMLTQMSGILAAIEVRSDSAAGLVEQIDLMAFESGKMTRTYWSRSMHDPTLFKQTDDALTQVATKFMSRLKQSRRAQNTSESSNSMLLKFNRTVPDSRVLEVQKVIEKLTPGNRLPLIPQEVDRDFVTYATLVPAAKVGEFKAAMKRAAPDLELSASAQTQDTSNADGQLTFEIRPLKNDKVQNNEKKTELQKKVTPSER